VEAVEAVGCRWREAVGAVGAVGAVEAEAVVCMNKAQFVAVFIHTNVSLTSSF